MPLPSWMDHPVHHFVLRSAVAVVVVLCAANLYLTAQPWLPPDLQITKPTVVLARPSRPTCKSFHSQAEAQAYFENNHAPWLDANRDGRACQRLP